MMEFHVGCKIVGRYGNGGSANVVILDETETEIMGKNGFAKVNGMKKKKNGELVTILFYSADFLLRDKDAFLPFRDEVMESIKQSYVGTDLEDEIAEEPSNHEWYDDMGEDASTIAEHLEKVDDNIIYAHGHWDDDDDCVLSILYKEGTVPQSLLDNYNK